MRKLWKGVLIGGAVGAGVAAVQAARAEGDTDLGPAVAKAAGEAALVGGAIGWLLDRRDAKRLAARSKKKGLAAAAVVAETAIPVLQHAAEVAARRAAEAADAARPVVHDAAEAAKRRAAEAADAARPVVHDAAEAAKRRAAEAADAARPHVTTAAEAVREAARRKAAEAADSTLRAVAERDGAVIVAV